MQRRKFIKNTLLGSSIFMAGQGVNAFVNESKNWKNGKAVMPVLFVGHGAPLYTLDDNKYSRAWKNIAERIPTPQPYPLSKTRHRCSVVYPHARPLLSPTLCLGAAIRKGYGKLSGGWHFVWQHQYAQCFAEWGITTFQIGKCFFKRVKTLPV